MTFDKYELKVLNKLSSYKRFFIAMMIASTILFFFGCYLLFTRENRLDISLTAASMVVLVSSYYNLFLILLLEKYRSASEESMKKDKTVCPKCLHEYE